MFLPTAVGRPLLRRHRAECRQLSAHCSPEPPCTPVVCVGGKRRREEGSGGGGKTSRENLALGSHSSLHQLDTNQPGLSDNPQTRTKPTLTPCRHPSPSGRTNYSPSHSLPLSPPLVQNRKTIPLVAPAAPPCTASSSHTAAPAPAGSCAACTAQGPAQGRTWGQTCAAANHAAAGHAPCHAEPVRGGCWGVVVVVVGRGGAELCVAGQRRGAERLFVGSCLAGQSGIAGELESSRDAEALPLPPYLVRVTDEHHTHYKNTRNTKQASTHPQHQQTNKHTTSAQIRHTCGSTSAPPPCCPSCSASTSLSARYSSSSVWYSICSLGGLSVTLLNRMNSHKYNNRVGRSV